MKILSGKYRNKQIIVHNNKGIASKEEMVRPTTAKVRLAIFNILRHSSAIPADILQDAAVLDLCAGYGTFGFEAISSGAQSVCFIENNSANLNCIKKTAAHLNIEKQCMFRASDVLNLGASMQKFNIVFLDPPYKNAANIIPKVLQQLHEGEWLDEKHVVVIESKRATSLSLPEGYVVLESRTYGSTSVFFLEVQ